MTLPRVLIQEALEEALAPAEGKAPRVMAYARDVDRITRDTVMVRLDEVTHAGVGWDYSATLVLVGVSTDDTGPGDDALDEFLENVLHALETHEALANVAWTTAKRGTYLGTTHPAYEIATLTRLVQKES